MPNRVGCCHRWGYVGLKLFIDLWIDRGYSMMTGFAAMLALVVLVVSAACAYQETHK
jgi:hypothetical protein